MEHEGKDFMLAIFFSSIAANMINNIETKSPNIFKFLKLKLRIYWFLLIYKFLQRHKYFFSWGEHYSKKPERTELSHWIWTS